MSVLILNCSARIENSISRELTQYLADCLKQPTVIRDLGSSLFPPISGPDLIDLHNGRHIERDSLIHQHTIATELIEELKAATTLVIGVPLYNFTVPSVLKQWIDYVLQPGLTFKYGSNGPVGLCSHIQKAFLITTSGGTAVGGKLDFASPYLELICNFIGVQNVIKINAGGSKKERSDIIQHAQAQIDHQLSIQRIPIQKQLRRTTNTVLTVN